MHYKNFCNATYAPAAYLSDAPIEKIKADIDKVGRYVKLDKIYLEPYRSDVLVGREKMEAVKALFIENGYAVSGGITTTEEGPLMGSMCYTNPDTRKKLGDIAAYTAELFDEVILDDFYFTNCRCESCIEAKGDKTWTEFRLALMNDISENVVVKRAKEANPKVKVVIKFPNWYESFPGCGYNLKDEPGIFDAIYTGTETRDPHCTHQNLQRYLSYFLPRLTERIKPGQNGGGWHDLFECDLEDYIQQIALTLFAKCRENMHFCFPVLADFPSVYAAAAGALSDEVDELLPELGEPVGIAVYKPYHSNAERHYYEFIGMCGIPLDPYPYYPEDAKTVLLCEGAAWDDGIVGKMKNTLLGGGKVFITANLYTALKDRGIEDILPLEVTDRTVTCDTFTACEFAHNSTLFVRGEGTVTMKHIAYDTNDIWVLSAAAEPHYSHPILLCAAYGAGTFYVLNIPDSPAELYKLPAEVLNNLRGEMDLPVTIEGKARIGVFLYDNDTFIVHSFRDRPEHITVRIKRPGAQLKQLAGLRPYTKDGRPVKAPQLEGESAFDIMLYPNRYAAFRVE